MIQVGRVDTTGASGSGAVNVGADGFKPVNFHVPFPDSDVAVIPQVQTYNDPSFVKARVRPLTDVPRPAPGAPAPPPGDLTAVGQAFDTGFELGLERMGSIATGDAAEHGQEIIGWMAFQHDSNGDTVGGDVFMADTTTFRITDDPTTGGISFCAGFTQKPLFFANIATFHGGDAAELRLSQPTTATQASVYIEEEGCSDEETAHITEAVSWFAIQHSRNHKIRATSQAPATAAVPTGGTNNGGTTHAPNFDWQPGEEECGAPPTIDPSQTCAGSSDPGQCWEWGQTAGHQAGQGQTPEVSCIAEVAEVVPDLNTICCREKNACTDGAGQGFPSRCSDDCAALWMPVWTDCEAYMQRLFGGDATVMASLNTFSDSCDATANGGDACTDSYFQSGLAQMERKCSQSTSCTAPCRLFMNGFWQTCRSRVGQMPAYASNMHDVCTGGSGH